MPDEPLAEIKNYQRGYIHRGKTLLTKLKHLNTGRKNMPVLRPWMLVHWESSSTWSIDPSISHIWRTIREHTWDRCIVKSVCKHFSVCALYIRLSRGTLQKGDFRFSSQKTFQRLVSFRCTKEAQNVIEKKIPNNHPTMWSLAATFEADWTRNTHMAQILFQGHRCTNSILCWQL